MKRLKECDSARLRQLLSSPEPLLLHFGTDWCAPCKRLERVLLDVYETLSVRMAKVNVEDFPEIAQEHSVTRNPTLCLFQESKLKARHEGFLSAEEVLGFVRGNTD